tara:strand:+ start:80 stop:691 length:612 start_codon:yes stop_codon:yes gene_type:complete
MSQHDFDVLTGDANTGTTFRSELNLALKALASQSSGASAPSTTYAYQPYIDTSTSPKEVYIRNAANTAWVQWGTLHATTGELIPLLSDILLLQYKETAVVANSTATYTFNLANGSDFIITLNANCTFTFPALSAANQTKSFGLKLIQDGTGGRTTTWPASSILKWPGGTAPTLSTGANDYDELVFKSSNGAAWSGGLWGANFS